MMEPVAPGGHHATTWENNSHYKANTQKTEVKNGLRVCVTASWLVKWPLMNKISRNNFKGM